MNKLKCITGSAMILLSSLLGMAKELPNIIFLLSDDQATYSLGCYGNPDVQTPNMDKLGKDGMIFDRHYNTTAICMASRANILTGMYEYKTGTNFSHGNMKPEVWAKSYPVLLRKAGYFTAFAGKFGMEVTGKGICEEDFDLWGGSKGQSEYETKKMPSMAKYQEKYPHSTLAYGAFAQDAIKEAIKAKKPLCLSISFKAPHKPASPDPKFNHIYEGKTFTKPANYGREHGKHLSEQSKQGRQYERFEEWDYDKDYDGVMRVYHQQIYAIDVALGMIRKELETHGIADNTVIIYTSDNGFICGSHGYGSKVLPMEEASRAPLMIFDPRSPNAGKGLRCGMLSGNIDFTPTILELAGLPIPSNVDGKSILPLLDDPRKGGHEQLALMNTWGQTPTTCLSTVTQRYKYTYWWYGDSKMEPTEELFDLKNDPSELINLTQRPEHKKLLEQMRAKYDAEHLKLSKESVSYNKYPQYTQLFDRNIPVKEKAVKPAKKNKKNKAKD